MQELIMGNPALVIAIVAQVLAIIGVVARLYKVTTPLHGYIPAKWRWLPEAVVGTCGTLTALLPASTDWVTFAEGCIAAVVTFVGFAVAGYHAPDGTTASKGVTLQYKIAVEQDESVEKVFANIEKRAEEAAAKVRASIESSKEPTK